MTRGPLLRGEMVRLRSVEPRDADRLWESAQDAEARRLMGAPSAPTREDLEVWASEVTDRPGRYDWAITPAAVRDGRLVSDELIGQIVLDDVDDLARSASIRLALLPNYRGRGYGREAVFEVLRYAFEGGHEDGSADDGGPHLHRVGLEVLSINPRARALYESLGFREEGRLRDVRPDGDGWSDAIVMSILEDEFRAFV